MQKLWQTYQWVPQTVLGSALFAAGFAFFLQPNDLSSGGISGLALILVELTQFGSVGVVSILINLPLFLLGGLKIGNRFFVGSLIGMLLSSVLIDGFAALHLPAVEPVIAIVYGGVLCGLGVGIVFAAGTSTGGSDILVRLLKLRYRNVPIGQISLTFDALVVLLTGIVFRDMNKALHTGITVFLSGKMVDAVVYRFDYSKVAMIITKEYDTIAREIGDKLDRGATFLHGEGSYSGEETKVILTAVKKQQIAQLKELVMTLDPKAFVIVQEAHQVLGDGFHRYSRHSL
ncbi:MAG: YitT family protein [Oscillospiraceae bacterium]|nr:YitT family protein [Oscillospiraceae bacterium]